MDSRQTVKTITRHTCFNKKEENINVDLLIMNKYIVVIIQWKNGWNVFTCRSWDTTAAHISITIWWKHIFGLRECLNSILTVTASHSCCEPLVPPHSKDVPLDWDLMTAEAAWVHWIEIISGLWHGVIPCWKQPSDDENTVVIKGPHRVHMIIIRNHTLVRLWHPHNIHLLWMNLKRAKKISTTPLRHTTVVLMTGYLSYCCGPIRSKQCGLCSLTSGINKVFLPKLLLTGSFTYKHAIQSSSNHSNTLTRLCSLWISAGHFDHV